MKSKVLLIDDSVTIHRVIDLSIDFDRYEITKVFTKDDAGIKLQSDQFDFILLDVKLENIVVDEYVAEIRQIQPNAKIILLVGNFDNYNEEALKKSGADDYLIKPFGAQALNDKLVSEADMMNASIVERMAEADFMRDKDDYTPDSEIEALSGTDQSEKSNVEQITKESYLENLEEVQPDDLTDHGYIEDDEDNDFSEFENGFSMDEIEKSKESHLNSAKEEDIDFSNISGEVQAEETIPVDNEQLPDNEEVIVEEPVVDSGINEEAQVDNIDEVTVQEEADFQVNDEVKEEEPVIDSNINEELQEDNINKQAEESSHEEYKYVNDDDWLSDAPVQAEEKHTLKSVEDNINNDDDLEAMNSLIVDHADMIVSPAAEVASVPENVSDDYIMYDNLAEKHTGDELVTHVPDFPEAEMEEENIAEDSNIVETENQAEEINPLADNENIEETVTDNSQDFDFESDNKLIDEVQEQPVIEEESLAGNEELFKDEIDLDTDLDDIKPVNEVKDYNIDSNVEEENLAPNLPESDEDMDFSSLVPDISEDEVSFTNQAKESSAVQDQAVKEQISPAINQGIQSNIGGITVTISREEIISMLGSAIDRHVLESAVKEVIAKNMQEIVRNIVPSIAEKYIKEEIERLKKDE